jgi:hypothetical protein
VRKVGGWGEGGAGEGKNLRILIFSAIIIKIIK